MVLLGNPGSILALSLYCVYDWCYILFRTWGSYIVRVRTVRKFSDWNLVRDRFREYVGGLVRSAHERDQHRILAAERRMAKVFFVDHVLPEGEHFRDVGGSRFRHERVADRKHICSPQLDEADALREDKAVRNRFGNCNGKGGDCPYLYAIPWYLVSHIDYHCDRDELCRIVTGPTVFINHDFATHRHFGVWTDDQGTHCEAEAIVYGNTVYMEPARGTPYVI